MDDERPVAEVVIPLIQPASVAGCVQWSDGEAIGDAMLALDVTTPDRDPLQAPTDWLRFAARGVDLEAFEQELGAYARSDADGRFRFDGIHPDFLYDVRAYVSGDVVAEAEVKRVRPGLEDLRLVLERTVPGADRLRGRVVDAISGLPLARYELKYGTWMHGHLIPFGLERATIQDPGGRFEVGGLQPSESYGLLVEAVNYPPTTFGPFLPSPDADVELSLAGHASLRIVVTDEGGVAQSGASVQFMVGAKRGFGAAMSPVEARVAGRDGVLEWPGLKPGACTLEAVAAERRSPRTRVDTAPGRVTQVHLVVRAPAGNGRLRVSTRLANGEAWAGARVTALQPGGEGSPDEELEAIYLGTTDEAGLQVLEGLIPGRYVVGADFSKGVVPLQQVDVPADGIAEVVLVPRE